VSEQHTWERDRFSRITLSFETRLARGELIEALGDYGKVCAGDRIVELDENIAGLDAIAVLNVEFANDAAGRVVDFIYVLIDDV
jgi:hypothetical protein